MPTGEVRGGVFVRGDFSVCSCSFMANPNCRSDKEYLGLAADFRVVGGRSEEEPRICPRNQPCVITATVWGLEATHWVKVIVGEDCGDPVCPSIDHAVAPVFDAAG